MNKLHTKDDVDIRRAATNDVVSALAVLQHSVSSNDNTKSETLVETKVSPSVFVQLFAQVVSFIALIALSPFLLVLYILIKLQYSHGFDKVQYKLGEGREVVVLNFCSSTVFAGKRSTTNLGKVLQRTGANQLPVLFSVLLGKISLREAYQIGHSQRVDFAGSGAFYDENIAGISARKIDGTKFVVGGSPLFWTVKRVFDLVMSLLLLPLMVCVVLVLFVLNPFWNKGRLFYIQQRMGKDCIPFNAIKFRSMSDIAVIERGPDDPVETHRVTPLGRFLRKCRLDELPQILNVLKGEMSLIGPRPDFCKHAFVFLKTVPGYLERHAVRPGISGLAQINLGYAVGTDATHSKTTADHAYIFNAGFTQEISIFFRTIVTVVSKSGS